MTTLSIAITFELPMVVYFLSKAGILTPPIMREYRRHAIVVILVLAAVITPTTDMLTMTLVALPFIYCTGKYIGSLCSNEKQEKKTKIGRR